MTTSTLTQYLENELRARKNQAAKAADLLRSAADRLDASEPDEPHTDTAARYRGAAVLALTAALELGAASGFVDCFVAADLSES